MVVSSPVIPKSLLKSLLTGPNRSKAGKVIMESKSKILPSYGYCIKSSDSEGKWITVNGTHVQIDGNGEIAKGPKNIGKISKKKPKAEKQTKEEGKPKEDEMEHDRPNDFLPDESRPSLNYDQRISVRDYTGSHFKPINDGLRDGEKLSPELQKINKGLESIFDKIKPFKEPVKAYRGMDLRADKKKMEKFISMLKEGKENKGKAISFGGYVSTTTDRSVAKDSFEGNFQFEIEATHGLDCQSFSKRPGEQELLMDHRSLYSVESMEWNEYGFRWDVKLKQLPPQRK